jgi:hypothetical protein
MLDELLHCPGDQITMHRVDGWQTLDQMPVTQSIDLAA